VRRRGTLDIAARSLARECVGVFCRDSRRSNDIVRCVQSDQVRTCRTGLTNYCSTVQGAHRAKGVGVPTASARLGARLESDGVGDGPKNFIR
jgi:hypothetical protein